MMYSTHDTLSHSLSLSLTYTHARTHTHINLRTMRACVGNIFQAAVSEFEKPPVYVSTFLQVGCIHLAAF